MVNPRHVEDMVNLLINQNLIHPSNNSTDRQSMKLFSFMHIPFIKKNDPDSQTANALIKTYEPHILSEIETVFSTDSEKEHLLSLVKDIQSKKKLQFERIDSEYGKQFGRKFLITASKLSPIFDISKDLEFISKRTTRLKKILLNILEYSLITQNEALGIYSPLLSEFVERTGSTTLQKLTEETIA